MLAFACETGHCCSLVLFVSFTLFHNFSLFVSHILINFDQFIIAVPVCVRVCRNIDALFVKKILNVERENNLLITFCSCFLNGFYTRARSACMDFSRVAVEQKEPK